MTIRFFCDCGKRLELNDSRSGETIRCPDCDAELAVPDGAIGAQIAHAHESPFVSTKDSPTERECDDTEDYSEREPRIPRSATSSKAILCLTFGLLSFCANLLTAVPAIILGILSYRDIAASNGRLTGRGLAVGGIIASLIGVILSTVGGVGFYLGVRRFSDTLEEKAHLIESQKNLSFLADGLLAYNDTFGALPPANFGQGGVRPNGQNSNPGLSWRVAILPFIGEDDLYREFNLDEPWDSSNNRPLVRRMPKLFAHPRAELSKAQAGLTYYCAFVGPGTAFDPSLVGKSGRPGNRLLGTRLVDFTDGLDKTLLVVEAADPVEWTRPDDLPYVPNQPLPRLGYLFSDGFNLVTADGEVHFVRHDAKEASLRGLITRNGGEALNWQDLE